MTQRIKNILAILFLGVLMLLLAGCGQDALPEQDQATIVPVDQLDEQAVQNTMNRYEKIMADSESIMEKHLNENGYIEPQDEETVLNELRDYAQGLYENGSITDYTYEAGDTCVYMEVDGWLDVLYTPPIEGYMSGGADELQIITLEPNATEFYLSYIWSGGKGPDEAAERIVSTIDRFSHTEDLENAEVTIETFRSLPKNSIIIFNGHGGHREEFGSVLFTGIKADTETIMQYLQMFTDETNPIGINDKGKIYLTAAFFEKYVPTNAYDGNLFYLGACNSFTDSRLAQSIWDKGARAIIGNTLKVSIPYNFQMTYSFCEGLASMNSSGNFLSIIEAVDYAKRQNGENDFWGVGSEVVACYRDDFTLSEMAGVYNLSRSFALSVYDCNKNLYDNYTLDITGTQFIQGPILSPEKTTYEKTEVITVAEPYEMRLEPGIYTFTLTDNADATLTETFTVSISDSSDRTSLPVYTEFGKEAEPVVLVSDAYYDSVFAPDYNATFYYHIPQINLPNQKAVRINQEIYNQLYNIMEESVYAGHAYIIGMNYIWGNKDNALSVLVQTDSEWGNSAYHLYNISLQTGEAISNGQLLAAFGFDTDQYTEKVRVALKAKFEEINAGYIQANGNDSEYYWEILNSTLSDRNVTAATPYVDVGGDLCVIATIDTFTGSGYRQCLINITGTTAPQEPEIERTEGSPAETIPEETQPGEASTVPNVSWADVADVYVGFLASKSYESYYGDYADLTDGITDGYAILDINQDGVPELIMDADESFGFHTHLIFTLDVQSAIVHVGTIYGYSCLRYSEDYQAIGYLPVRPTAMDRAFAGSVLLNGIFVDTVILYYADYGNANYSTTITDANGNVLNHFETESEYNRVLDSFEWISWQPIQ